MKKKTKKDNSKHAQSKVGLQEEPPGPEKNKQKGNNDKRKVTRALGHRVSRCWSWFHCWLLCCALLPAVAASHNAWADFSESALLHGPVYMGRERAPWVQNRSEPPLVQPWHVSAADAVYFSFSAAESTFWHTLASTWRGLGIDVGNWWVFLGCLGELVGWVLVKCVSWTHSPNARFSHCRFSGCEGPGNKKLSRKKAISINEWRNLCQRKGPWRRALQSFLGKAELEQARLVKGQRVCGVRSLKGLHKSYRHGPFRFLSKQDRRETSSCKRFFKAILVSDPQKQKHVSSFQKEVKRCGSTHVNTAYSSHHISQNPMKQNPFEWSQSLIGGGSKRNGPWRQDSSTEMESESSLAEALTGFLRTWQEKTTQNFEGRPPKKPKQETTQKIRFL